MTRYNQTPHGRGLVELDATSAASIRGGGTPAVVGALLVVGGWLVKNWKDFEEGFQSVCNSK